MNPSDLAAIITALASVIAAVTSLVIAIRTRNVVKANGVTAPSAGAVKPEDHTSPLALSGTARDGARHERG